MDRLCFSTFIYHIDIGHEIFNEPLFFLLINYSMFCSRFRGRDLISVYDILKYVLLALKYFDNFCS